MNRWKWTAVVGGVALLLGCGGNSLPSGKGGPPGDPDAGDATPPEASTSLYPLTTGSSWTYRITEASDTFEKTIEVMGPTEVPDGSKRTAIRVLSTQPHLSEDSWQVDREGIVYRVWEEDSKEGVLVRTTRWDPDIVKALSAPREAGWAGSFTSEEIITLPAGDEERSERTFVWQVVGTESVTVPAGTFPEALKIERLRPDKPEKLRTYWVVPGVGKVKETGERLEELLEYEVLPGE